MRIFFKKIVSVIVSMSMPFMLIACTPSEEVWTGQDKNPIQVVCGKGCRTIRFPEEIIPDKYRTKCWTSVQRVQFHHWARQQAIQLTPEARYQIKHFVYRMPRRHRVFVSPCATNPGDFELNELRIAAVKAEIRRLGYTPVRLKSTLPADLTTRNCINLVRGDLKLYVQRCPNKTIPPSVETIGSNFGCTTNYNLAQMVINPWNFLATGGDNGTEGDRVALGIKNYREGKESKLDMESSS